MCTRRSKVGGVVTACHLPLPSRAINPANFYVVFIVHFFFFFVGLHLIACGAAVFNIQSGGKNVSSRWAGGRRVGCLGVTED